MSRIQPELSPEDPQKKGNYLATSTNITTTNQLNGEINIDKLYPEIKPKEAIIFENPYNINGGSMRKYNFISKHGKFPIQGKTPIDALRNGLAKLENENQNIYKNRKQISVDLQKENNNRMNKLHKFMVKIYKINNPVYQYKIELWKL